MIISHKYKFIYIRSQKTASTSLDVFFSAYCDDNDIVTVMPEQTPDWHNATRFGPLNNNHVPARDVYDFIGADIFYEYYKFTSIRNPLDKMLSCYFWWRKEPQLGPGVRPLDYNFSDWIMRYGFEHELAIFHAPYYKIYGEIVVDDYIRYESLEADLKRICELLGMEYDSKYLLHYKKVKRKDVEITEAAKDKIRHKFAQELIDLNYEI